jgi:hypothetical protein
MDEVEDKLERGGRHSVESLGHVGARSRTHGREWKRCGGQAEK